MKILYTTCRKSVAVDAGGSASLHGGVVHAAHWFEGKVCQLNRIPRRRKYEEQSLDTV